MVMVRKGKVLIAKLNNAFSVIIKRGKKKGTNKHPIQHHIKSMVESIKQQP